MNQFESVQKFGKDGVEAATKAFGAYSRNAQVVAVEATDYAKRSFEQMLSNFEGMAMPEGFVDKLREMFG